MVARNDARLYEHDREAFFENVSGSRAAAGALEHLVDTRLGKIAEVGGRIPP